MRKSFDDDKGNREQLFEIKLKEVINLDQKFSQAMESEILVRFIIILNVLFNTCTFSGEKRRRK